jgi:hypothetical protein
MKYKNVILFGVLLGVLLVTAFSAGQVYAGTGCFSDTNGHMFETYICWMKEKGITSGTTPTTYSPEAYVTRGQMAVFMQRVADIPPSTGVTFITQSLTSLLPEGYSPTEGISYYLDTAWLYKMTAPSSGAYVLNAVIPTSLYGQSMYLAGVQVCYDATNSQTLTSVYLRQTSYAGGVGSMVKIAQDNTSRSDAACRIYLITSPALLSANNTVGLKLTAGFTSAGAMLKINSVTMILSPSTSVASMELIRGQSPAPEITPLTDMTLPGDGQ